MSASRALLFKRLYSFVLALVIMARMVRVPVDAITEVKAVKEEQAEDKLAELNYLLREQQREIRESHAHLRVLKRETAIDRRLARPC